MRVLETLVRAFTSSRIGMGLLDLDGRWVEVNPALCRLLDRDADALIGHSLLEVTHPDDVGVSAERMGVLAVGGDQEEHTFEKRYVRPDGSVVWARVTSSVAIDDEGRPEAIFSQLEDVTAAKQAAELLRASDERFERVFEDAPVGMTLISTVLEDRGRLLRVNAAFCRLMRAEPEELVGRYPHELLHPDDVAIGREEWYAMLAGQMRTNTFDRRLVRSDGSIVVVRNSSSVVHDADGQPLYVVSQQYDITESWEAERRFRAAFEDAPIPMALASVNPADDGRAVRVNQAMCALLRTDPETMLATPAARFFARHNRAEAAAEYRELIFGERQQIAGERELLRADGTTVWAAVSARVVRDDAGQPVYVIAQFIDIDDRRRAEERAHDVEARFRGAFVVSAVPMLVHAICAEILLVNDAFCDLLGAGAEDLIGRDCTDFVGAAEIEPLRAELRRMLRGEGRRLHRQVRCLRADGRPVWTRMTSSLVRDAEGRPSYVVTQMEDITAEREATRMAQLRMSQQTAVAWLGQRALTEDDLDALFDAAVGVVAATCEAPYTALALRDGDGLRMAARFGWPPHSDAISLDPRSSHAAYALHTGTPVIIDDFAAEQRFDSSALLGFGVSSGMSVAVAGESGDPYGVLNVHATEPRAFATDDIAFLSSVANVLTGAIRRAAAARDLRHQSLHDPLTQLPNRALMLDRLRQGIARSRRDGSTLAVLFCDMDDFKYVNDTLGHEAGDRLLAQLAPRLRGALRTTDTLARFGGDEFVMLCEGLADPAEVIAVADRVLTACAQPIDLGGTEFVPTASIGIALSDTATCTDPEALLRDADVAMYRAKTRGKGRYELFDATMRQQTVERVGLLGDLRRAVARDELRVVFQPVVSLRRRRVSGVEALVRWQHPQRGLLTPDHFIALAQDSGLIDEIGAWVIDEAVRQTAQWQRRQTPGLTDVMCGVNVSWRQLSSGMLLETVAAALERHGLDARYLCAEVTESAVLEDEERARDALDGLSRLGVHLALDDFGTGQSSLAVLRNFPFDALKLDRSFAAAGDWDIVRAVTQMARSLNLLVIAEGIERADQEDGATALDCDFGQGWLYGRAVPASELEALVQPLTQQLRVS
jgi:diguanylate cyclase (GGDEF)-like protein/PAS domain S-box-containing protein